MHKKVYPQANKKTNGDCPSCGFHISYSAGFDNVLAGQFDNSRQGSYTAVRVTPVRASTITADVAVPLAQSLIWSIAVALPTIPISYALRYEWYFPLVISSISMLAAWVSAMKRSEKSQSKIEEFTYTTDERQSGETSSRSARAVVKMEVTDRTPGLGTSMKIVDLPAGISDLEFREFCNDILAGRSMARKNWAGSGKPFSRDTYDQLAIAMQDAGLTMAVPGKGKVLTAGGRGAIRAMIRECQIAA